MSHIPGQGGGACGFSEVTDEAAGPPSVQPWGGTEPCPVEAFETFFMFPICSAVMGFFFPGFFFFFFPLKCTHAGFGYLSIFPAVASLINSPDGSPLHREGRVSYMGPMAQISGLLAQGNPEADMGDPK